MWWPGSGEGYEQLAKGMADLVHETYDWITVDHLVIPWGDYDSKMNVAFAGGTAPDIFGVGMNPLPNYVQTGNLLELENVLPKDWDGWRDIPENVLNCATFDGHFYGVMMCDVRPMIYWKDLFEKAGLTDVPKNKEELWEYAKKLTERGDDGKVTLAGFQIQTTGYADQTLFFISLMHGQKQLWDDNYNLLLKEPAMIDAMEYTKRFITEGLCDYSDAAVGTSDFASGKAAISLSTSCNELGNIRGTLGLDKIGVAVPPTEEGSNFLGGTIVSVNNKSANMEATMLAYEVMTGTKGCELAGLCAGFCPRGNRLWMPMWHRILKSMEWWQRFFRQQRLTHPYDLFSSREIIKNWYSRYHLPIHLTELEVSSSDQPASLVRFGRPFPATHMYWHDTWNEEIQSEWFQSFLELMYSLKEVKEFSVFSFCDAPRQWGSYVEKYPVAKRFQVGALAYAGILDEEERPKPAYFGLKYAMKRLGIGKHS